MANQASLLIVAAPSGTGKTSLVTSLVDLLPGIVVSVSHTTRPRRSQEQNGVHYYFVDQRAFAALIEADQFLEHARVFDHQYGTTRAAVEAQLAQGLDVILEIDWQGAAQARARIPECVSIFILPPSRKVLEERLRSRAQDSDEIIARRMRAAVAEMRHYAEFDYLVINDDFERALDALKAIVLASRQRLALQVARERERLRQLLD
ncbi:MAG: guanylate kinase [Pseudomonadota bacterium]|nr:guanylate kinase [Pseudomonadota bacterium]